MNKERLTKDNFNNDDEPKIYYGIGEPKRKGFKKASMIEAAERGKVMRWGEFKIDPKILENNFNILQKIKPLRTKIFNMMNITIKDNNKKLIKENKTLPDDSDKKKQNREIIKKNNILFDKLQNLYQKLNNAVGNKIISSVKDEFDKIKKEDVKDTKQKKEKKEKTIEYNDEEYTITELRKMKNDQEESIKKNIKEMKMSLKNNDKKTYNNALKEFEETRDKINEIKPLLKIKIKSYDIPVMKQEEKKEEEQQPKKKKQPLK
jgi:hypothetical protein